jgi:serine/threonine protein kinase
VSETASAAHHVAGDLIARKYRLVRRLGQGGMGSVWEARNTLERRFAIKFLLPELALNQRVRQRFEREARAAAAIESEHVVAVFDFGVTEASEPFIVMEYLKGEDLGSVLAREDRLSVPRATELVRQAATGLHQAHLAGVIHRDLKPQNLFVTPRADGTELCRVLDFGVAKLAVRDSGISTRTGNVVGTLDYMPPEQLRGEVEVDARADVYSLGCVLYECLAGRRPFDAEQAHVLMYKILESRVVRLEELRPELPRSLAAIVHRALDPDPERRLTSALELAAAIAPFSGRAMPPEPMSAAVTRSDQASELGSAPTVFAASAPRTKRRGKWAAVAFGSVVLATLALASAGRRQSDTNVTNLAGSASTALPTRAADTRPSVVSEPPRTMASTIAPVSIDRNGSAPAGPPASPSSSAPPNRRARRNVREATPSTSTAPSAGLRPMRFDLEAKPYD